MAPNRDRSESTIISPDDAFSILGDPTRLAILQALWDEYTAYEASNSVPFSELYTAVGYDDTGNFNYHLQQLLDHFVRRTSDGYELTEAGHEVIRAVITGTVNERPAIDREAIDVACPLCGAPLEIDYENQRTVARCTRCSGLFGNSRSVVHDANIFHLPFPPGGWEDRSPEAVFHATVEYNFHQIAAYRDGICPHCAGIVDETIDVCFDHQPGELEHCQQCHRHHLVEVRETCRRCKSSEWGPLTIAILTEPVVTAFYYEHGIDHRFASWDSFRRGATIDDEILETDPLRIGVTIPCEEDRLRLVLDETLSIIDAETGGASALDQS